MEDFCLLNCQLVEKGNISQILKNYGPYCSTILFMVSRAHMKIIQGKKTLFHSSFMFIKAVGTLFLRLNDEFPEKNGMSG